MSANAADTKKRVSFRLNGKMPEDRLAIEIYNRVLGEFGTNAAGDMVRRWVLGGFLVWLREGGLTSLDELAAKPGVLRNNESNTPSNNDSVVSTNESGTEVGVVAVQEAESVADPRGVPQAPAGFVGMLGMGLSSELPR